MNMKTLNDQKAKSIKRTKQWEVGYREGVKDGKLFIKQSREEKRMERKDQLRREIIVELREKFKEIFGFITENDLDYRMQQHLDSNHNDENP